MGKTFVRGKEKYSLAEEKKLGELVEYDKEVKALQGKTHYDYKRKKHVLKKPKQGFLATGCKGAVFRTKY